MLPPHLERVIVGLSVFLKVFREDDILPPGLSYGGFLYIAIVYFNSHILVVFPIFEGKPTTGFVLSELLMRTEHFGGSACPDEPLVRILLQFVLSDHWVEDYLLLACFFDGLVINYLMLGDDLLAASFKQVLFLFVEDAIFAELRVEEAESGDSQSPDADECPLSILHN